MSRIIGFWSGAVLTLLMTVCAASSAGAVDRESSAVRLDTVWNVTPGETIEIGLNLEAAAGAQFGGFDFLIGYDDRALRLESVLPGEMVDACAWEYFTTGGGPFECEDSECPDGFVRVVAIAETINGPFHPSCLGEAGGELARFVFTTSSNPEDLCEWSPIRFWWLDCGDNAMSSRVGDTLYVSDRVLELGWDITYDELFPTHRGAPETCIVGPTVRTLDFHDGGISFACELPELASGARIMIDRSSIAWSGDTVRVGIDLQSLADGFEFAAYDLMLVYDPDALELLEARQGQLGVNCGWEMFFCTVGPQADCGGEPCPPGVVRVVSIADNQAIPGQPSCYASQPGRLAELDFLVSADSAAVACSSLAIDFLWPSCAPNAVTDANGAVLCISRDVYDSDGFLITQDAPLPSRFGAPSDCGPTPERVLDFFDGRIDMLCAPPSEGRGDVNCNGIPYEIADWVIFQGYFIHGLAAFTVNLECQIAATDCNDDGLNLTLADLVYMYRVIVGDVLPLGAAKGHTAWLVQDTLSRTVHIEANCDVAALWLTFSGEINPEFDLPYHDWIWIYDRSNTVILITPDLEYGRGIPAIPSGLLMSYGGEGQLIGASAASDGVSPVVVNMVGADPQACCIRRGNADHSVDGAVDVADLVFLVNYMFKQGVEPPCADEADADGLGGSVDISDVIYLVNYMFKSGPVPPPCPPPWK